MCMQFSAAICSTSSHCYVFLAVLALYMYHTECVCVICNLIVYPLYPERQNLVVYVSFLDIQYRSDPT